MASAAWEARIKAEADAAAAVKEEAFERSRLTRAREATQLAEAARVAAEVRPHYYCQKRLAPLPFVN